MGRPGLCGPPAPGRGFTLCPGAGSALQGPVPSLGPLQWGVGEGVCCWVRPLLLFISSDQPFFNERIKKLFQGVCGTALPHLCGVVLLWQFVAGCDFVLSWVYSAGYFTFPPNHSLFLLGCFGVWAYLVNALAGFIFDLNFFFYCTARSVCSFSRNFPCSELFRFIQRRLSGAGLYFCRRSL